MRILNRPMFKYGGPIKQGIMHGMKNGGKVGAFNVGSPVKGMFPKDATGREHHLGPGALLLPSIYAAGRAMLRPFGSWALKKFGPGVARTTTGPVKNAWGILTGQGSKEIAKQGPTLTKNVFTPNKLGKYFIQSPEGRLISGGAGWAGKAGQGIYGAGKWVGKSPLTVGSLVYMGGKWLWPDGTPANENEIKSNFAKTKRTVGTSGAPGGGDPGMFLQPQGEKPDGPSAAQLAAEAKAARTAKLEKYLDTMGYDKAKKGALGDALIDASAIVQDATTEAGSLKKADWGKMINKAIQTTSKRLDKPEQIREAVGLMMTKADIEKDLEDPQVKELRRLQIAGAEKTLAGKTTAELIQERMLKGDYPSGKNLARLVSLNNPGANIKVIPSTGMKPDEDTIDYITTVITNANEAGKPFPPGNYVIKDRIIQVDETGTVTPIPISALK